MNTIKELLPQIDNFLISLINTRYINEKELYEAVAKMCTAHANRLAGLDPDRNR